MLPVKPKFIFLSHTLAGTYSVLGPIPILKSACTARFETTQDLPKDKLYKLEDTTACTQFVQTAGYLVTELKQLRHLWEQTTVALLRWISDQERQTRVIL